MEGAEGEANGVWSAAVAASDLSASYFPREPLGFSLTLPPLEPLACDEVERL
jgi:hypothetical protein